MTKRGNGEGSIYFQESRQRYAAAVSLDGGKRKVFYGKTRQEVAKKLLKALERRQQNLPFTPGQLTVAKFMADWLESTQHRVRPSTYRSYEQLVRVHIVPALGRVKLAKLQPGDVQVLLNAKAGSLSPRLRQYLLAILRAALGQAKSGSSCPATSLNWLTLHGLRRPTWQPSIPQQLTGFWKRRVVIASSTCSPSCWLPACAWARRWRCGGAMSTWWAAA
jgi:integrase